MARNREIEKRGRGRPEVDTEPVTVRLHRDILAAVDKARRDLPVIPSRPDVLRTALMEWLKGRGYLTR